MSLKNGFVGQQINTMGWVRGQGRDCLIAMRIETTNAISALVWRALAP